MPRAVHSRGVATLLVGRLLFVAERRKQANGDLLAAERRTLANGDLLAAERRKLFTAKMHFTAPLLWDPDLEGFQPPSNCNIHKLL